MLIIGGVLAFFLAVLAHRLWEVQIKQGEEHRENISRQSIRKIREPGPRGRILTSDFHILADNRPSYDVIFHLSEMRRPGQRSETIRFILDSARDVGALIGRTSDLRESDILRHINLRPGLPMTVFGDLDPEELGRVLDMARPIPGMEVTVRPVREYPEGRMACHILGRVGADDPRSAEDRDKFFYYIPDKIGITGLERKYDATIDGGPVPLRGLRGEPGKRVIRVDHLGFVYETIGASVPSVNGHDLVLTLDYDAQKAAEETLADVVGAIVLIDAENGAVLAMASSPSFDLSEFTPFISRDRLNELYAMENGPFRNRAVEAFTPGSIVKPLVALSFLENGVSPRHEVRCAGAAKIGNARIRCWSWRSGGHGALNIVDAIKHSCNVFFIENSKKVGMEAITKRLSAAGLGRETGFPLPESAGLLPTRDTKRKRYGTAWNAFDTALLSMGQGLISATPLQAALFTAAIANGGIVWRPRLLKELRDSQGNVLFINPPRENGNLSVPERHLELVRKGMWWVVNASDGTAKRARCDGVKLSGKTGTAEMGPRESRYANTWFIAFGEVKGRLCSLAVFVERGVSGGRTSAPMARRFLERWLELDDRDD